MPAGMTAKIIAMCEKFGLPTTHQPWNVDELYASLTHDKNTWQDHQTCHRSSIGTGCPIHQIPMEEMLEFLQV